MPECCPRFATALNAGRDRSIRVVKGNLWWPQTIAGHRDVSGGTMGMTISPATIAQACLLHPFMPARWRCEHTLFQKDTLEGASFHLRRRNPFCPKAPNSAFLHSYCVICGRLPCDRTRRVVERFFLKPVRQRNVQPAALTFRVILFRAICAFLT